MSTPSTIDIIKARLAGQEIPQAEKSVKVAKPTPIMTEEQLAKREDIRSKLQVGSWIIEFTKVDGTNSIMEATLDPRLLTESDPTVFAGAGRVEQLHLLHVYAVDRQGWRSFVVNNVTKMYRPSENL